MSDENNAVRVSQSDNNESENEVNGNGNSICRCPRHFWFSFDIMENAVTVQKLLSHSHTHHCRAIHTA